VAENPLKKYFRQPKIFIDLPSKGLYCKPGTLLDDAVNMPVYGMTGMDEVISKTPDALLTGDATARIIESCVPTVKDAKQLSVLDLEFLMVAIRIATYGNSIEFRHTCSKCQEINDFEIDLGNIITHYKDAKFNDTVAAKEFTVKLKPLTIAKSTEFSLAMFKIQRSLFQLTTSENPEDNVAEINKYLDELAGIQNQILSEQIEGVEIAEGIVEERAYLDEWLKNVDADIFDKIRKQIELNRKNWDMPDIPVKCDKCEHDESTRLNMDPSSFFAKA